ncbi:MAG: hypothetical protein ACXVEF_18405 [Polyangiales bacterium]
MNIRACLLLAMPVVGLSFAETNALAQIVAPKGLPQPTLVLTSTKIESVQLSYGASIPCSGTSVGFNVALVGANKVPSSGKINVTRFVPSGTNQVVSMAYSLGLGEKKSFTVTVPVTYNCHTAAAPHFSVKIEPTTGGWDGVYRDLNPTGVTFTETRSHDAEVFSTADANKSKVQSLKINGGLVYSGGGLKFTAALTANSTVASSGKLIVTKRYDSGQYTNVQTPFTLPAGGSGNFDVSETAWGTGEKIPSFRATLDGQGPGGWDGWWVDLVPQKVLYGVSSANVNAVPA